MDQEIRPIGTLESTAICWGVATLAGVATFALLLVLGDWTFLQAAFGGVVVVVGIGIVLTVTVGRPTAPPSDAAGHVRRPTETRARASAPGEPGEPAAPAPADAALTHAPSPHRTEIPRSMISENAGPIALDAGTNRAVSPGPGGTPAAEAAPATRIPGPAPVNAADSAVARPVGATFGATPMGQPTPFHGRVVSPEPPVPLDGDPGRMPLNETAPAGGATPMPTATAEAQSYNEVEPIRPALAGDAVGGGTTEDGLRPTPVAGADRTEGDGSAPGGEGTSSGARDDSADVADRRADAPARAPEVVRREGVHHDAGSATPPTAFAGGVGAATPVTVDEPYGAAAGEGRKPETLSAPRGDGPDDLKQIRGVGPKLEQTLNEMGFYHYSQIAAWSDAEVAWVDANLEGFPGRVSRDEWVPQARLLAEGGPAGPAQRADAANGGGTV